MQIIDKKFPLDLNPRKSIGFNFPLNGNAVFNKTTQTKDQIKANLINYLLTNKGERIFKPEFGADLRNLIFNVIDPKDQSDIKQSIQSDIKTYFPDVVVDQIEFKNSPDRNLVNFILTYSIKNYGVTDSISINVDTQ